MSKIIINLNKNNLINHKYIQLFNFKFDVIIWEVRCYCKYGISYL